MWKKLTAKMRYGISLLDFASASHLKSFAEMDVAQCLTHDAAAVTVI